MYSAARKQFLSCSRLFPEPLLCLVLRKHVYFEAENEAGCYTHPVMGWVDKKRKNKVAWKLLSRVQLFVIPWNIQSMEFSKPDPFSRGSSQSRSPTLRADSLPAEPPEKPPGRQGCWEIGLRARAHQLSQNRRGGGRALHLKEWHSLRTWHKLMRTK